MGLDSVEIVMDIEDHFGDLLGSGAIWRLTDGSGVEGLGSSAQLSIYRFTSP
jgi:hypothetical protein